jgi:hypothetical protein
MEHVYYPGRLGFMMFLWCFMMSYDMFYA